VSNKDVKVGDRLAACLDALQAAYDAPLEPGVGGRLTWLQRIDTAVQNVLNAWEEAKMQP